MDYNVQAIDYWNPNPLTMQRKKHLQPRLGRERMKSRICGQKKKKFIYIIPFFIKVNIEHFLLGYEITKSLFFVSEDPFL